MDVVSWCDLLFLSIRCSIADNTLRTIPWRNLDQLDARRTMLPISGVTISQTGQSPDLRFKERSTLILNFIRLTAGSFVSGHLFALGFVIDNNSVAAKKDVIFSICLSTDKFI